MSVSAFMALLAEDQQRYPRYHGELYVELHRGVQTVQALIKKRNRQCESALRELEMLDVMGDGPGLPPLEAERIRGLWKVLLKNQFHDILPGTRIPEEHIESLQATGKLLETAEALAAAKWEAAEGKGRGAVVRSSQGRYGYVMGTSGPRSSVSIIGGPGHSPPDHLEGEGLGATLAPQSLYRDQLSRRLGSKE
jgi:hypothetical protein